MPFAVFSSRCQHLHYTASLCCFILPLPLFCRDRIQNNLLVFRFPDWEDVSAAASQDFLISAPEHIFGCFLAFSHFLFSAEHFHHSLPLCGHLSFFPENQNFRYSRLRSVSPHSAVFSCFPKKLAGIFTENHRNVQIAKAADCFPKNSTERFHPRIIRKPSVFFFSRHSLPVFPRFSAASAFSMARDIRASAPQELP